MGFRCGTDVRGAGRYAYVCVCECARVHEQNPPPSVRQAALSLCTGAVCEVCAARLASLRTEWTRFPAT